MSVLRAKPGAVLGLAGAFTVATGGCSRRRAPPSARPNVLLVTIDTLRADHLGCYGRAAAATPTLDALAARGVRFATAVAHVPLTGPSHASILTAARRSATASATMAATRFPKA